MRTFKITDLVKAGFMFAGCLRRPLMVAETKFQRQVMISFDTNTFRLKIYTALFATLTAGMFLLTVF
jgi:hypothetical protein